MDGMKVLDQGYIQIISTMGSDQGIVEAARMSTQKGFLGWGTPDAPGDEKLLRHLYRNKHTTPFEMAAAQIEVKAPIFVFREWHRHRTQSFNEMSARYVKLPNENYVPDADTVLRRAEAACASKNNQARGTVERVPTRVEVEAWLEALNESYAASEALYEKGLSLGIPKELARIVVPVARYSVMRAQANLLNWMKFIGLRSAPNAQYEIRAYSDSLYKILKNYFPRTFELLGEDVFTQQGT